MLTIHQSISPKSYNKIPANIVIVYSLISHFFVHNYKEKTVPFISHCDCYIFCNQCVTTFRLKQKNFIQQTSNNQICEGFTGIFTLFADCSTIFHIFSSICRKIWNLNISVIKLHLCCHWKERDHVINVIENQLHIMNWILNSLNVTVPICTSSLVFK